MQTLDAGVLYFALVFGRDSSSELSAPVATRTAEPMAERSRRHVIDALPFDRCRAHVGY